uniref:MYB transcription factor n=1 Tax=Lactuca sativa TaxID=4236 RepID=A0A9R1VUY7_LACSA|nr:hypothetical protein LSAT_V11C400194350 [Lactuca sativa]
MGTPRKMWTLAEESALLAGVAKHGAGKWKTILTDEEFAPRLVNRSNVDLKVHISSFFLMYHLFLLQSYVCKLTTLHFDLLIRFCDVFMQIGLIFDPLHAFMDKWRNLSYHVPSSAWPAPESSSDNNYKESEPWYHDMILQALSSVENPDGHGIDINSIHSYIEQKSDKKLPEVFSIYLTTKLRRMATQGKIERVSSSTHESIPSFLIVLG